MKISFPHITPRTTALLLVFALACAAYSVNLNPFRALPAQAGTNENVSGYAWSENIGWISFNSTNDGSAVSYGVNLDTTNKTSGGIGNFSGNAWSENIGWISFNRLDTGTPPFAPFSGATGPIAQVDWATGKVTGWARALSGVGSVGGWDGWIKLSDDTVGGWSGNGVRISGNRFAGYAWGGGDTATGAGVVGWIDFAPTVGGASVGVQILAPTVSFQGAGCILPVGGGSCNITAWWSVSGLPQGETLDINVTGPGIALNYKNLPADSTLLAQAVTKAQNLAAIILGFPTAKPQATPFVQPVSSTGSFSMSLLQHSNGATLATLPPLVSCPAGYTIVNGSCVAPVVLPCTAPNVTTWSSCQSSATCTTPPSQLTGQSGFRTGICPTPQYTGTVIEACSTATVTCTAPPTLCGNGICETGETFLNCSKDCKSKVQQF